MGNIMKIQLWHNNLGNECHEAAVNTENSSDTNDSSTYDTNSYYSSTSDLGSSQGMSEYSSSDVIAASCDVIAASSDSLPRISHDHEEGMEEITVENCCSENESDEEAPNSMEKNKFSRHKYISNLTHRQSTSTSAERNKNKSSARVSEEHLDEIAIENDASEIESVAATSETMRQNRKSSPISNPLASSRTTLSSSTRSQSTSASSLGSTDNKKSSPARASEESLCCVSPEWCGSHAAWFVSEVSVSELLTGTMYAFPCFSWLSVTEDDTRVEREISLETPTTFMQVSC